jgi:hypothetical protein
MIGEHFAIRDRDGRWRYRQAQGVLQLPAEFSEYLRGRHRQAVRTNVGHARKAGLTVRSCPVVNWAPGPDDTRAGHITAGPIERWTVLDRDGEVVADSILSVDEEVALLHGLVSTATYARWLLHTAIVERLCGRCGVLLTNSDDAYLMAAGNQHFQRLLGYEIARLRLRRSPTRLPKLGDTVCLQPSDRDRSFVATVGVPSDPLSRVATPRAATHASHLLGDEPGVVLRPPDRERDRKGSGVPEPGFAVGTDVVEFS